MINEIIDESDNSYIKLYRKSLNSAVFQNKTIWFFWSWCLLKASHKGKDVLIGYQVIHLNAGQFVMGRKNASKTLKLSEQQIRDCIFTLFTMGNITTETTNKYTIVTICNWDTYQNEDSHKEPTKNQQRTNKEPTKNHKQYKEEKIIDESIQKSFEFLDSSESLKNSLKDLTTICSEQKNDSAHELEPVIEKVIIELPLNTGAMYPITESVITEMSELYPAVDMLQEFRNMKGWLVNNPKKRKTLRGIKSFYNNWLHKVQNRSHPEIQSQKKSNSDSQYKLLS